ncbi:MAG: hypothetical protein KGS61_09865 [Verrucomicrobia bacterium]|nr:hypothetical protein [Verrucomicrobiota bacterium]
MLASSQNAFVGKAQTIAAVLLVVPAESDMLAQNGVLVVNAAVVRAAFVAHSTGLFVSPLEPIYHWYCIGPPPLAITESLADPPVRIL